MFIKPLYEENEFDVFLGNGWENWVRVKILPFKRSVEVIKKAEGITVTDKLKELIFFKARKVSND